MSAESESPAPVGRAGTSAPRPRRKTLAHDLPLAIRPDAAVLFLTVCCQPRGENHLCQPSIAAALFESIAFRQQRGDWWMSVVLLMPDHLHALVSFPVEKDMKLVVGDWKKFTARQFGIHWQRDFFEHRLRNEESLRDKQQYIHQNPVRGGLVVRAEDWPFVWMPEDDGRSRRGGPPRPTNVSDESK